jgi:hypothetical protein
MATDLKAEKDSSSVPLLARLEMLQETFVEAHRVLDGYGIPEAGDGMALSLASRIELLGQRCEAASAQVQRNRALKAERDDWEVSQLGALRQLLQRQQNLLAALTREVEKLPPRLSVLEERAGLAPAGDPPPPAQKEALPLRYPLAGKRSGRPGGT